jgi:translation initiation factor IF-3
LKSDKVLVNKEIRAQRVTLIDAEGNRKGEFLTQDAIKLAQDEDLDLVVVGGDPSTPTCKLVDYGKFLYDQKKKTKKSSSVNKLKEVKLGFTSGVDIVELRTRQAEKFLKAGHKVKVTVTFRGRERAHLDMIYTKCKGVSESLAEIASADSPPRHSGRSVSMILSPRKQQ